MADLAKPAIAPVNMSRPSLARDLLLTATQAYKMYPGNCSGAVNWVIVNMVDPQMPPLLANDLMAYFAQTANGWRQVAGVPEASELANRGVVVVAGKAEPGKHGARCYCVAWALETGGPVHGEWIDNATCRIVPAGNVDGVFIAGNAAMAWCHE